MQQIGEELKSRRVEGAAGGGMVTVEANGAGEILSCRIDPTLITSGDRELIEDLLPAAINQALERSRQLHAEAMKSLAAGFDLPGADELLSRLSGGEPKGSS
jgi:DNA-binding YbaB/EbfC family protein